MIEDGAPSPCDSMLTEAQVGGQTAHPAEELNFANKGTGTGRGTYCMSIRSSKQQRHLAPNIVIDRSNECKGRLGRLAQEKI